MSLMITETESAPAPTLPGGDPVLTALVLGKIALLKGNNLKKISMPSCHEYIPFCILAIYIHAIDFALSLLL